MADEAKWKKVFQAAHTELDPVKQLRSCQQARRLVQDRLSQIAATAQEAEEREELEAALRALWVLEQRIRKPDLQ